ncbi:MAG TPA: PAS domain-containing protein [Ignavibacteriales bacterium]|nr:PAS domain-containing protein [Ignavibacteriales bacterium]
MSSYFNTENFRQKTAFSFIAVALIFVLDALTPRVFASWILYMVPISIVPYKTISKSRIYLISSVITILIWSGFFIKLPGNITPEISLINRAFITLVMWIVAWVQIQRSNVHKSMLKSEEELRKSEEGFRLLAEGLRDSRIKLVEAQRVAHIGSYTLSYTENTLECSEELYRIFGWDPNTKVVTYDDILNSIHPEDYELVTGKIRKSFEERTSIELDYRIVTGNGEIKYLHTRRDPVFDNYGNQVGAFGISMDITQRKLQALKLEEAYNEIQGSESRLLEAQRLAHVGSWELDLISGKRIWTEEAYHIFEFEPAKEAPHMDKILSSFHPEDRSRVTEKIMEGVNNNTTTSFEARLLLPGNKIKFIKYIARPVYNDAGQLIKRVGAVADITELKIQQVKLENTLSKLQESETKLLEAQKLASLGRYSIDFKNGGRMEWSDEMYNIWELDKNKPLPNVEEVWKHVHPDDLDELKKVLYSQLPGGERVETVFRILFPEGRVKYVHIITRVIFDKNGRLLKREGIEMDITERKTAQMELESTLEKLEKSNKELEQFAYIASHDLQEPLRMVSGYMGLLEKRYGQELDEKAKGFIHYAVDGSNRMSNLIKDLLKYSRVTTRAKEFKEVDLNKTFSDVTHDLQVLINERKAKISSAKLPIIKADPVQMHQLLQNIIGNAIKFQAERTPEVSISAEENEGWWLFSVKDNGIGIDPQFFDRIFQVFQRLHEMDKYPGTGIGLAICKKIVERHGGKIWVESEQGKGSAFYFTIPDNGNLVSSK